MFKWKNDAVKNTEEKKSRAIRTRIKILAFLAAIPLLSLFFRAYELQIVKGAALLKESKDQTIAKVVIEPARGDIFDRNGAPIVSTIKTKSLFIRPRELVVAKEELEAKLIAIFPQYEPLIRKQFQKKGSFIWILKNLTLEDDKKLESSGILKTADGLPMPGIGTLPENTRSYPYGELAAPIIGFVNWDGEGLMGIEKSYDELLKGRKVILKGSCDARRRVGLNMLTVDPTLNKGTSLILTIDKDYQYIAEKAIKDAVEKAEARLGIAIISDPQSGELLAIAEYPSFDISKYYLYNDSDLYSAAVEEVFEPGSTLKTVTIAGALDKNAVKAGDVFNVGNGSLKIGPNTIHDSHGYGGDASFTVEEILVKSSNVGTALIGMKLGSESLYKYLKAFGFGQKTGLPLPGEPKGLLRHYKKWMPIDLANAAFGQGVSVTPFQIVQMVNVVAADGILAPLKIIKGIITNDSKFATLEDEDDRMYTRAIKVETAKLMREIMAKVTDEGGTGTKAAIEGIEVAGKTGTAQKYDKATKTYSKKLWTSWFVGMLPADKPELSVVILIDEPLKGYYGGELCAPVFKRIVTDILKKRGQLAAEPQN